MKSIYSLIIVLIVGTLSAQSQHAVCLGDSLKLESVEFRGELFWQFSSNGQDWTRLNDQTGRTLSLIPTESSFYRYEVYEGTCEVIYSDFLQITVNAPPLVSLTDLDSICINESALQLSTGLPSGGQYEGPGIVDGRLIPSLAGAGQHRYSYGFTDELTTCSDTAVAMIRILPLPSQAFAGDDLSEIMADSVRMNATNPVSGSGFWTIINGEGGRLSDPHDPTAWFYKGDTDRNYTLRWTVENTCDSYSDDINLTFLKLSINPCPGTPVVYDADGNAYPTIQIGNQCWMGENLKVGVTVTSTLSDRPHSDVSDNGIIERYVLDNTESNADVYGGLYDWDEMMGYTQTAGAKGICPDGWHIPTVEEWDEIEKFYKTDTGDHLKVGGQSGFNGLLAGDRHNNGSFVSFDSSGFFWTSSSYTYDGANDGWVREICACTSFLDKVHFSKKTGASVRCIQDK